MNHDEWNVDPNDQMSHELHLDGRLKLFDEH